MLLYRLIYEYEGEELTPNVLVFACDEVNREAYATAAPDPACDLRDLQYDLITDMRSKYFWNMDPYGDLRI